jgi:type II secretory pathway component PulF
MIGFSDFSVKEGPFVFAGLIALLIAYIQWRKTEKGRIISDRWILKVPMISSIYYNADICRITNIMGILLGNGVNTTESLRLAENTVQNRSLLARFQAARTLINDGAPFSASFKRFAIFSDMDIDILNIGENTGSVVAAFKELYRTHSIELESKLKFSTNLLAGGALAFAFVMVFVLTLGIVTSILQLSETMMGG